MIDITAILMTSGGAIAGGAAGYIGRSLIKKIGYDAAGPIVKQTMATFEARLQGRLFELKTEIVREINGTYVRAMGSTMTGAEIERALERLQVMRRH